MNDTMRSLFPEYANRDEEHCQQLWSEALFVFDTSSLLNLYRYSHATADKLLAYMGHVSERIWIPHQIALEYVKNRGAVIDEQRKILADLKKSLLESKSNLDNLLGKQYKNRHRFIDTDEVRTFFASAYTEAIAYIDQRAELSSSSDQYDAITARIENLISDKIGPGFSQSKLLEIYRVGKDRYELKIPPGYEDDKTKQGVEKYGDLVVWFQLLEKAAECKRPIIFVTDDRKSDWMRTKDESRTQPRPELTREMLSAANTEFCIYSSNSFIKNRNRFLDLPLDETVVEEVEAVSQAQRTQLELLATDEAALRTAFASAIENLDFQAAAAAVLQKEIAKATSMQTVRDFTEMWAANLNLTEKQQQAFLSALDFQGMSRVINEQTKVVLPPLILPAFSSINFERLINVSELQASLQRYLDSLGTASAIDSLALNRQITTAVEMSAIGEAVREVTRVALTSINIGTIVQPFIESAMKTASIDWSIASLGKPKNDGPLDEAEDNS